MLLAEAETKISHIKNVSEREVGQLLLNLGLRLVACNSIILNTSGERIGEIDLIFTFEDTIFLVEVSADKHSGSNKKISFFSKWADSSNLKFVKQKYKLGPKKVIRIYFDLAKNRPEVGSAEIKNMTQKGRMNHLIYKDDYEYFSNYRKLIGPWAKNDFLDFVNFSDDEKLKVIDSIQYYIGELPVFCFVEKVENLLRTCYISRRRIRDLGYQRALKRNRIVNIANNIKKEKGLSFPNSILINTPKLTENLLPPEKCPGINKIYFPMGYNKCRIIDGQHRLLGFSAVQESIRSSYSLPVIAFQSFDRSKEIETFVDINSKQQRIDGNLILLLKSDLDWPSDSKEFKEKIAVRVSEKLNKTFFKNRIFFGMVEETKGDKITLTTLVSAMRKNEQIEKSVDKTYKKLNKIFNLMSKYLQKHSFNSDTYFGHNRGMSVLFRLLRLLERNREVGKINIAKEIFFKDLRKIFNEKLIKNLDNLYGEGGDKAATELIVTELKSKFPTRYKKMEANLIKIPKPRK